MKIDNIRTSSFNNSLYKNDEGISLASVSEPVKSLSAPFSNPYKPTNTGNTKGKTAAERNNNPFNIKFGKFASKYGATQENKPALDGGSFATFPTVEAGLTAAKDLLLGTGYRNLTVDAAMKRWSNKGYGGNIYPEIAQKKIAELSDIELDTLQKKQIVREDRNYAKKLGFFKYGGKIPTYEIGGLTPRPYNYNNPLNNGFANYTNPTAVNTVIQNNTRNSGFGNTGQAPQTNSGVNGVGLASMGLGLAGSALDQFDTNPKKVNKGAAIGSAALKGAGAGASLGGIAGSVLPGVGNVAGAAIGGVVGGATGAITGAIKAKKRQKLIDQNIANDQKYFNQQVQDRSTNLYAQLNPYQYKLGGEIGNSTYVEKPTLNGKVLKDSFTLSKINATTGENHVGWKARRNIQSKLMKSFVNKEYPETDITEYDFHVRPFYNPLTNNINVSKNSNAIVAELAHAEQNRQTNPLSMVGKAASDIIKSAIDNNTFNLSKAQTKTYRKKNTIENDAHDVIEPKLKEKYNNFKKDLKDGVIVRKNLNNILGTMNPNQFKYGGSLYEAEKNEIVQGDAKLEAGKQIANNLHLVGGNTHENGGTLGIGGDRVFSNSISFKGKTVANHAKSIGNKLAKFEKNLSVKDNMKRKTAEIMTGKLTTELDKIFDTQEEIKSMNVFKYGGLIPQYAEGGDLRDKEKEAIRRRIKTLDKYLNDNTKRQAIGGYDAKDALRKERNTLQGQLDNSAIWNGKVFNPLEKPKGNGKLPVQDIAWTNDLNPVSIKGQKTLASPSKNKRIGNNITARNQFNIPNTTRIGNTKPNFADPLAGGITARANQINDSITSPSSNRTANNSSSNAEDQRPKIDPLLATGLGLSAAGYLNTAANINRMNTDVPVNLTASPYYGYRDRSRLARQDLTASANTILRNPNIGAGQKQAIFSRLSGGINQINDQENSNRFQYDNDYNHRAFITNAQNNAMLNQSVQQRIANQNAQLGLRTQNFNSLLGNVNTSLAEQQKRKLDERRMNLIANTYKRNYGTDFDIPE